MSNKDEEAIKRKPVQEWTSPYKPYHHENTKVGHNQMPANKDI